jgi:ribosomal protein L29
MPTLKFKDIQKMSKQEREKKLKELKFELTKSHVSASKAGTSRIKEIKKIIAKMLTLNNQENKNSKEVGNKK